uniref:Uncharacterized protein n=1 Tax=Tanacetum cinerariifolium TaxID=118510 RepID=A0A6L2L4Q6_TANCI|nr:hypothetical protein [Tanacetum cinerariifolium]
MAMLIMVGTHLSGPRHNSIRHNSELVGHDWHPSLLGPSHHSECWDLERVTKIEFPKFGGDDVKVGSSQYLTLRRADVLVGHGYVDHGWHPSFGSTTPLHTPQLRARWSRLAPFSFWSKPHQSECWDLERVTKIEFPKFGGDDVKFYDIALIWHEQFVKTVVENVTWMIYKESIMRRYGLRIETNESVDNNKGFGDDMNKMDRKDGPRKEA